jgi:hypothetical protein
MHYHFDKIGIRMSCRPSRQLRARLQANAHEVGKCRRGHPIRNSDAEFILPVTAPNRRGLELIAEQPGWIINYIEVARDIVVLAQSDAMAMRDEYDKYFVQPHHGKRELVSKGYSTSTDARKRAGVIYVWYGDGLMKLPAGRFGEPRFHFEGRHQGVAAVRGIGIHDKADILTFDFQAYFKRNLNFYEIDFERLGRFHRNRRSGSRRQKPFVSQFGSVAYNHDRRLGGLLYRTYGKTNAFARFCDHVDHSDPEIEEQPPKHIIDRCVQKFIDRYGRGPFLRRRDAPLLYTHTNDVAGDA